MATLIDSTQGVRVALHDLGGTGPPLVMLHATGFHGRCYDPIAAALHDDFRVWAPDLRGHGDTVTPAGADLAWRFMVDDTLAVVDHLGAGGPLRFAGHSMGGATVVFTELTRPGTVRAAWLFEPIIFPSDPDLAARSRSNPLAELARRRRERFSSRDEAYERYASKPPFSLVRPDALRAYVDHGFRDDGDGVVLKCRGEQEARVFEGVDTSIFDRLGEVTVPITVVGSGDGEGPAELAPTIADRLPDGHGEVWADRTHFAPFEDPERTAAAIRAAVS